MSLQKTCSEREAYTQKKRTTHAYFFSDVIKYVLRAEWGIFKSHDDGKVYALSSEWYFRHEYLPAEDAEIEMTLR